MSVSIGSAQKLIEYCIEIIETFNPLRITPATQFDDYIAKRKIIDDNVKSFIREVFYGVERYAPFIDVTIKGLYEGHSAEVVRNDRPLYRIFTLLACRKLEEMGFEEFYKLVQSQKPHKMKVFLKFLWDDDQYDYLVNQWGLVYDVNYVKETILGTMGAFKPEIDAVLSELEQQLQPKEVIEVRKKRLSTIELREAGLSRTNITVPQPFQLTRPKASIMPAPPIVFDTHYKANPVPTKIFQKTLKQIEQEDQERKLFNIERTRKKHENARAFSLETHKRPSNLDKLKKDLEEKEREKYRPFKAKPAPKVSPPKTKMKVNIAAVLREDHLYRQQDIKKAAKLKEYQESLRDASEFKAWQVKMREQDEEDKLRLVDQRRQELANANVKIKAVLEEKRLENREKVLSKKEEIKQRIIIKKQEQAVTLKQKAQLVEFIKEQKSKVHLAVDKVQEVNREVVVKAKEERVKRKKQLEKEKEEEMKKKKEFIQKIQALEKLAGVRGKRPTEFDPTQSSGLGLLDEMSLVELHERLNLLKLEYKDQEERKRKAIQEDRKQKASVVDAIKRKNDARRANNIGVGAVKRTEKRAVRKIEKKKAEEKVAKDAAFMERKLADKRERKREAALKLAKELHQRKVELNFIFAGKERAAAKQGEDLARGNIRQEKQHFRRQKLGKEVERRVAKIDHRQKLKLVKQEKRAYRKKMKEYNKKCKEKEIESQHYIDEDSKRKKEQATLVKTRREAALRAEAIRAPFVAKVKNFQAEKAKGLERRRKAIEARNLARSAGVVEVEDLSMMPTLPMEALEKTLIREELDDFTYTQHPMYNDPVEVEAVL